MYPKKTCVFIAPESCVEAQLRYGFPASGLFWIDIDGEERDYDALQIQCDMSTIPAATLLSHNREGTWMHSKNHLLHIEHVDTLEYSLDHTMVSKNTKKKNILDIKILLLSALYEY